MEISNSHLLLCSAHIDLFGLVCDNYKEMICKGSGFLKNKNTNDLKQEIAKSEDLSQFLRKNEGNFLNTDIPTALSALQAKKKIPKATIAKRAFISEVYLHQIFSGRRKPSRDKLLCICIGMDATLDDIQTLLHQCGFSQLYAHNKRDAILMYGILHQLPLEEINDTLFQEEVETIF